VNYVDVGNVTVVQHYLYPIQMLQHQRPVEKVEMNTLQKLQRWIHREQYVFTFIMYSLL